MDYSISDYGILWVTEGETDGTHKVWFNCVSNEGFAKSKEELPYHNIFAAKLYDEKIVVATSNNSGRNYYIMDTNSRKIYEIPISGNYYPRRSTDGTIYFEGSGKCIILHN